jgi:hypothetical protein
VLLSTVLPGGLRSSACVRYGPLIISHCLAVCSNNCCLVAESQNLWLEKRSYSCCYALNPLACMLPPIQIFRPTRTAQSIFHDHGCVVMQSGGSSFRCIVGRVPPRPCCVVSTLLASGLRSDAPQQGRPEPARGVPVAAPLTRATKGGNPWRSRTRAGDRGKVKNKIRSIYTATCFCGGTVSLVVCSVRGFHST